MLEAPLAGQTLFRAVPGDFAKTRRMNDGRYERQFPDGTTYLFNATGKLEVVRDRNRLETRFIYDVEGRITVIVDSIGKATTFFYNGPHVQKIVDPAGREYLLEHDASKHLTKITFADGTTNQFTYDANHLMTSMIDARGGIYSFRYDRHGKLVSITQPDDSQRRYQSMQSKLLDSSPSASLSEAPLASSFAGLEATFSDETGKTIRTLLDHRGQAIGWSDSIGIRSLETRDPQSNLVVQQTNGRGFKTSYEYDSSGNVVAIRDEVSNRQLRDIQAFPDQLLGNDGLVRDSAIGDLNGDRLPDLAVLTESTTGSDFIQILFARGDNSFSDPLILPVGGNGVRQIELVDLNQDNSLDIVSHVGATNFGAALVWLNLGNGIFSSSNLYRTGDGLGNFQLANVNQDNFLDLIVVHERFVGGGYSVLFGDGGGGFRDMATINHPRRLVSMDVADLNNDGRMDFVAATSFLASSDDAYIAAFYGQPNRTFVEGNPIASSIRSFAVTVLDLNGDGFQDVIAGDDTSRLKSFMGSSNGLFTAGVQLDIGGQTQDLSAVDLDSDGDSDVIASTQSSNALVSIRNNDGVLQLITRRPQGGLATSIGVGDIDLDGTIDVVVANTGSGSTATSDFAVLYGSAPGVFGAASHPEPLTPFSIGFVAIGEFDGDSIGDTATTIVKGVPDLRNFVSIQRGDGQGGVLARTDYPLFFAPIALFSGDVDEDLDIDIVSVHGSGFEVLVNDGLGNMSAGQTVDLGFSEIVNAARWSDVDSDGNDDLILNISRRDAFNQIIGHSIALFLQRSGGFLRSAELALPEQAIGFDAIDVDKDGTPEIATVSFVPDASTGRNYLIRSYASQSLGVWNSPSTVGRQQNAGRVLYLDADHQHSLDLVYSGDFDGRVAVYTSTASGDYSLSSTYLNGAGRLFLRWSISIEWISGFPDG